jgi:hypothetical protein
MQMLGFHHFRAGDIPRSRMYANLAKGMCTALGSSVTERALFLSLLGRSQTSQKVLFRAVCRCRWSALVSSMLLETMVIVS